MSPRCPSVDEAEVSRLFRAQAGVISRAQVMAADARDCDIERMLRRRMWARVTDGVYVEHTGPLGWNERAWAAVLRAWPSVLSGPAALRAFGLRGHRAEQVEVAIAARRRVRVANEFAVVRLRDYDRVALPHLSPPRMRLEAALVQVAGRTRREDDAIAVFADACQERRTTAARLLVELNERERVPHRRLLTDAVADVDAGARSPLEVRYLRLVERAHGLPSGRRQQAVRPGGHPQYRDVEYVGLRTLVELNGRLGHEWAADVWDDLDRDLDSATTDLITLRAGWRQVLQPCRLAGIVGQILVLRGWAGRPHLCGPACNVWTPLGT